jgi:hypothetical protein
MRLVVLAGRLSDPVLERVWARLAGRVPVRR